MVLYGSILLLLLGGLQGLLLSFFLLRKKAYREGYGFLMVYLGVLIAQILLKVADKVWLMQQVNLAYNLSYQFPWLYGPLAWLFTRNFITRQSRFSWRDGLHFLPFVLASVPELISGIYVYTGGLYRVFSGWTGLASQLVCLGIYHYLALGLWRAHFPADVAGRPKWLRRFLVYSWWVTSVVSFLLTLLYQTYPRLAELRFGFALLSVFIYWVSYCAVSQPYLFLPHAPDPNGKKNGQPAGPSTHRPEKKYANSTLKASDAARIVGALQLLMQEKKAYTDPGLTIEKLAVLVQTNRHTLSQVLNERLGLSFFDYINGLRVEEVKRRLKSAACKHHKIAAVAYDAGFNSISVFNDVFKKMTGQTPSEFRKLVRHTAGSL